MSKPLTKAEVNRVMKTVQRTGHVPPGYSVNFRAKSPVTRVADRRLEEAESGQDDETGQEPTGEEQIGDPA